MKNSLGPLGAIIAGALVLQVANGILGVIVPLQMGLMAKSTPVIGAAVTAYALGFLISCVSARAFIQSIGHIRAFAALAAILSVATLLFVTTDNWIIWAILRFCTGLGIAGLFAVAESWIAGEAPSDRRGRIIAIYMVCNKTGIMAGQVVLALGDAASAGLYLFACACFSVSLVPVALTRARVPTAHDAKALGPRAVFKIAPAGIVGCFGAGMINAAVLGLTPVYGLQVALPANQVPWLIMVAHLGSLLLQWPLGWLSDRIDRRRVIVAGYLAVAVVSLAIALTNDLDLWLLLLLYGLWGGFALSVYSLCIAHAGDHAEPAEILSLITSLLLAWGVGSAIGPAVATAAMTAIGPAGLFYFAVIVALMVGGFVAWRMTRRASVDTDRKDGFVNLPTTSPAVGELSPAVVPAWAADERANGDDDDDRVRR